MSDGGIAREGAGAAKAKKKRRKSKHNDSASGSDEGGDSDEDAATMRKKKIQKIMKQQEADEKAVADMLEVDERDRKYGAIKGSMDEPTEEEMEAYRLRLKRADDPMSHFVDDV